MLLPSPNATENATATSLPTDPLDAGTPRGRIALAAALGGIALVSSLVRLRFPELGIALPLASTALLPLFFTGTRAQLVPSRVDVAARLLRPARDALASAVDLSHVDVATIARVVDGAPAVDELRLSCVPRDRTPGLRAVELAVATCPSGSAVPEVLLRFDGDSAAADRIARLAPTAPVARGRAPEERVARLSPAEENAVGAAALLGRLLLSLEGRRASDRHAPPSSKRWSGPERRLRPAIA
jgi:hypothetical protein